MSGDCFPAETDYIRSESRAPRGPQRFDATHRCPHEPSQYRHYRPCRPRQDNAGRPSAAAGGLLPRQPAGRRARARFERSRTRARHHHPVEGDIDPLAGRAHQYRGHTRSRRFRRRSRAHPQHGGRRAGAGRCRRRAVAADQVRGHQGAQGRTEADRHHQQGRPVGRPTDRGRQRGVRSLRRARRERGAARFPDPIRLGQAGLDGVERGGAERSGHGAAIQSRHPPRRAASGRSRPVPHDRHDSGGQSLSRPRRHRPHLLRRGETQPGDQGPRSPWRADRGGTRHQGPRLPRPGAGADRRGLRRRHHLHRRPAGGDRLAHALRARGLRAAAGAADRPADAGHDLPHQRFPARRHRGRQGAEPGHPRAAAARGGRQRRLADLRNRRRRIRWRSPAAASCSSAF